jgi:hypothetical protein
MATFWNDVRFLAGKPKAKAEGFETDGTFLLILFSIVARNYRHWSDVHGCVWMMKCAVVFA